MFICVILTLSHSLRSLTFRKSFRILFYTRSSNWILQKIVYLKRTYKIRNVQRLSYSNKKLMALSFLLHTIYFCTNFYHNCIEHTWDLYGCVRIILVCQLWRFIWWYKCNIKVTRYFIRIEIEGKLWKFKMYQCHAWMIFLVFCNVISVIKHATHPESVYYFLRTCF